MTRDQYTKVGVAAQDAWEEDAKTNPTPVNPHAYVYGFKAGAQTILDNPQEWGLVESSVMETCRKLRLRITGHEAENQRYREALETALDLLSEGKRFNTAKVIVEALKNNEG